MACLAGEQEALPSWMTESLQPAAKQKSPSGLRGKRDVHKDRSTIGQLGSQPAAKRTKQCAPQVAITSSQPQIDMLEALMCAVL